MPNPFTPKLAKFSIITPVYGKDYQYLPKYFKALDEQDFKNFEVIISFDGKNKAGEKMLAKMIKQYPKMDIQFVSNPWGGAPVARNNGAKLAKGDFLIFPDADTYLYSDALRFYANKFEEYPDKDVIWGLYEIVVDGQKIQVGGMCPTDSKDEPIYWAFRFSNYCAGSAPIRKEAFVGWRAGLKSLQDWDMWLRMLAKDNFQGKKFKFFRRNFSLTEPVRDEGISHDSSVHWIERVQEVKKLNNIPLSDICVTSIGAPWHGINAAKLLGFDYLPQPSFKPHKYKTIYLLGFYTSHPQAIESHLGVFGSDHKLNKIVHWIGTDIWQLGHSISVQTWKDLRETLKKNKVKNLTEIDYTHDEMEDLDIETEVVPLPPAKLYEPTPLPAKFTIGIYENETQSVYNEELMEHIARAMPDIEFKFFGDESKKGQKWANVEHLGWIDYDEWIPKMSLNLRITKHDGLPLTPVQFLTAGRNVVCNVPLKGTIKVGTDRKEIVTAIRKAQKKPLDKKISSYWRKELSPELYRQRIGRLLCLK